MSLKNPVKKLDAEVARKIAAGEVIDRPNAIVRELMDNSIDSGAKTITVEISGGGIEKIRIVDDGCGMTKEDLQNCARPHATSKISSESDLLNLSTLGFRGEALASIAAVSRLQIISSGLKMRSSITEDHLIEKTSSTEGTIVLAEGLFENFPARRIFLKKASAEGVMCKNTFIEKSLPYPEKSFRFVNNGEIKIDLFSGESLKERFVRAMEFKEDVSLFNQIDFFKSGEDFSFKIVIASPSVYRSTKKDIYIFVNGRRIQEYALVQAIEYGCQGFFPNGTFPVASLFVNINPRLVDFNIHPAKKEVRFKDISSLHHQISVSVREFLRDSVNLKISSFSNSKENNFETLKLFDSEPQKKFDYSKKITNEYFPSETSQNKMFSQLDRYKISRVKDSGENFAESSKSVSGYEKFASEYNKKHPQQNLENEKNQNEKKLKEENAKKIVSFVDEVLKNYTKDDSVKEENISLNQTKKEKIPAEKIKFLGSCLGTFLIAEFDDALYLVDQHAAHERLLFNKIMENQGKSQKKSKKEKTSLPPEEQCEFFNKNIELKVAKILKIENNPEAEKLYIETLDDGSGKERIIQSGLREFLSPEELIGKNVIIVSNLQSRKIRGVESRGMLLAASFKDGEKECVEVLQAPWAKPGDKVVLEGESTSNEEKLEISGDEFFKVQIKAQNHNVQIAGKNLSVSGTNLKIEKASEAEIG